MSLTENSVNSSLNYLYQAIENLNYSIDYIDDLMIIKAEDGSNSSLIINITSGLAKSILNKDSFEYKGATGGGGGGAFYCFHDPLTDKITDTIYKIKLGITDPIGFLKNMTWDDLMDQDGIIKRILGGAFFLKLVDLSNQMWAIHQYTGKKFNFSSFYVYPIWEGRTFSSQKLVKDDNGNTRWEETRIFFPWKGDFYPFNKSKNKPDFYNAFIDVNNHRTYLSYNEAVEYWEKLVKDPSAGGGGTAF
ncbi:hypothetical protein [Methanobrevibacter arboriphilus]|uniref:hypothetical protein n=1 Tax=Methanobrevibacter arboriphilus TaxID=39441 RepID=UPI0005B2B56C|nr:hypothetical protein [Methanobrevibacter arboriphilus]